MLHHYKDHLPSYFYTPIKERTWEQPQLLFVNEELEEQLQADWLNADTATGNAFVEGSEPIAMAYAGHQFGHFTILGDGRAFLLGETEVDGTLYDIHCKGGGRTKYSRGGDGQATLGAMVREFIVSEAMHALGVPTTRSLCVATTGNVTLREKPHIGATLLRVAKGHIRVGTFEYAALQGGIDGVRALFQYTVERFYPECLHEKESGLAFMEHITTQQFDLAAKWMSLGFIHGVMNTDNMSLSGETIDYGPCAFMETYDPKTVFSSIDQFGRYAYDNQPEITMWNLRRLAAVLLPLAEEQGTNEDVLHAVINHGREQYEQTYWRLMARKFGIANYQEEDNALMFEFLDYLRENEMDYTNAFIALVDSQDALFDIDWLKRWRMRLALEERPFDVILHANPRYIPRNGLMEQVIREVEQGNYDLFHQWMDILSDPYTLTKHGEQFTKPMDKALYSQYRTYCGT